MPARALVVGASVAGVAAAVGLRDAGFGGEIVLLGDERHPPYDRPPLSKQLLRGATELEAIGLPAAARLEELGIEHRHSTTATGLDLAARELELEGGERLGFDGLLLATGSAPRRLPGQPQVEGIYTLRTADDALGLRAALTGCDRVAIVGAGFIGLEVASEARGLGVEATVVDLAPHPLARVFGPEVGERVRRLHEEHGVEVRCGAAIDGIAVAGGRVAGIELPGETIAADVVVIGIGAAPATGWLAGSGLEIGDGVVCDAGLQAAPGVYAAGDVARWEHPVFGSIRVEHWTTAGEHARVAAANLAAELNGEGERRVADSIPYFWSDQHGVKIQLAGWIGAHDEVLELEGGGKVATLFGNEGMLVGALAYDWPAFVAKQRRAIGAGTSWSDGVEAAEKLTAKVSTTNLGS